MILFRRFCGRGNDGGGVLEALRGNFCLELTTGARGNAENRLALMAPTAGLGGGFSSITGDPHVFDGVSGKSVNLLYRETGRLLGGCGGLDLDVEVDERESDRTGTGRGSSL